MTEAAHDKKGQEGQDKLNATEAFVAQLNEQERMLIILQSGLYEDSWQAMLDDLHNRLDGKPYIFKLANRINDDIERIEQMQDFENQYGVDLAEYVDML